jgi:hypothetical protein
MSPHRAMDPPGVVVIAPNPVKSFAQAAYMGLVGLLLLLALGMFVSGQFSAWRSGTWQQRAEDAAAAASTAQGNADSANAGAANATTTREALDWGTVTVRVDTAQSAERIQNHVSTDPDPDGLPDPDVVRELEAADRAYRAAGDRLQRAHPR